MTTWGGEKKKRFGCLVVVLFCGRQNKDLFLTSCLYGLVKKIPALVVHSVVGYCILHVDEKAGGV